MAWCPYRYRCDLFPKWVILYFCKIAITLIALTVAKKGHKNKKWLVSSIPSLQRHISVGMSMKLWRFLWHLKELKPILSWKMYRSPKGSCIPKMHFFSLDESKIKYGFKDIKRWNICTMSTNIIPRSNCIRKETTHVPQWFTFEFMEGVTTTLPVQWSAESRKFVFKIRRRLIVTPSYVFAECAYTNDDQIMIPTPVPDRALNDMNLAMHR